MMQFLGGILFFVFFGGGYFVWCRGIWAMGGSWGDSVGGTLVRWIYIVLKA